MLRLLVTALLLNLLVVMPLWWRFGQWGDPLIAWEAWVLSPAIMLLKPGAVRNMLAAAVVAWGLLVCAINLGDTATHLAFGRSFNLYLDVPLLAAVYNLLQGNVGQVGAFCLMALGVTLLLALAAGLFWLLSGSPRLPLASRRGAAALTVGLVMGLLLAEISGQRLLPRTALPMVATIQFQGKQVLATRRARQAFSEQLAQSPLESQSLPGLAGRDVLLTFVESYGISALNDTRYSGPVLATLDDMQTRFAARGLHVVSGLVEAPVRGGQSWLAHATLLSGRWIDNQLWYRLMLESGHSTLIDDFKATGQRTLGVMPAISMAWPEGAAYGFDEIAAAHDIPYAGPALNWVTMPDQYTLDYIQRHYLGEEALFLQTALISSHAPWTPILPVLDNWSLVGDGSIYAPWAKAGDPPEVLWQTLERIRDHYSWSVNYSVEVTGRWAERVVDEQTLLIVLGDHQPAPMITGDQASAAVPVHVISADPALLAPFREHGFVSGTLPDLDQAHRAPRMSEIRRWLQVTFQ